MRLLLFSGAHKRVGHVRLQLTASPIVLPLVTDLYAVLHESLQTIMGFVSMVIIFYLLRIIL